MKLRKTITKQQLIALVGASVVEANTAREMLYALGYCQRREGDDLKLYKPLASEDQEYEHKFYYSGEAKVAASLYIDEGYFSDTMMKVKEASIDTPSTYIISIQCPPYIELVDAQQLMRIVISAVCDDYKPDHGSFLGHGRTQNHLIAQHKAKIEELFDAGAFTRA